MKLIRGHESVLKQLERKVEFYEKQDWRTLTFEQRSDYHIKRNARNVIYELMDMLNINHTKKRVGTILQIY